jgi:hypothetical protein
MHNFYIKLAPTHVEA